jgi:hypothetical protein
MVRALHGRTDTVGAAMANEITEAAIAKLERSIEELEGKIRALRTAINTMCVDDGLPPRYPDAALVCGGSRLSQIQDDTFYGKKQTPAMREYLEMRKAQGLGPATPREIYDALKSGGYQFGTSEKIALVSLRALLRTQPLVFHKLPQGTYGLTAWYPDPKRSDAEPKGAAKKRRRAPRKPVRQGKSANASKAEAKEPALKIVAPDGSATPKNQKAA